MICWLYITFLKASLCVKCIYICFFQMVDKLREHLNRHLSRLGKKKIDLLVVNYAAKLVCVCAFASLIWNLLQRTC